MSERLPSGPAHLPGGRLAPAGAALALAVRTLDELTGVTARPMALG